MSHTKLNIDDVSGKRYTIIVEHIGIITEIERFEHNIFDNSITFQIFVQGVKIEIGTTFSPFISKEEKDELFNVVQDAYNQIINLL